MNNYRSVYAKIPNMDTTTLTINLPKDIRLAVENKARLSGRDSAEFIEDLVAKEVNRPSLDEILAPIRNGFKESGDSEDEIVEFFEEIRDEVYQEKLKAK